MTQPLTPMPLTQGAHHIGLTVSKLEATAGFFIDTLGWREVRRDPAYPAIFVSDGVTLLTLWAARDPAAAFDKNHQVGLHHAAFMVTSEAALAAVHERVQAAPGVTVEFAPELLRQGPAKHMMCYEPSGIRIEFIWPGT